MPDSTQNTSTAVEEMNTANTWQDPSQIPTTPIAPEGGIPAYPGDDSADIPTTPIAPEGGQPAYPGDMMPWPDFRPNQPDFPMISFPVQTPPSVAYYGQVRFLNASTNGMSLDVLIDGQNVFSGSSFATVSNYSQISDGFHTITIRRTNGPILYQQTLAFISGEWVTMVILDHSGGVTLSKVSDMGCTNVPSGYGCLRVANMSYNGSSYDVRLFNNQVVFAGVGYKDVTSLKQASAGTYTFFVTSAQFNLSAFNELSTLVLASIVGSPCTNCAISNPLLTFNVNVQPGRTYTSYIIGNPWSNLYRVFTLED